VEARVPEPAPVAPPYLLPRASTTGLTARTTIRRIAGTAALILVSLSTAVAYSQATADSTVTPKPRLYALVAAVGEQIAEVYEAQSTGSPLSPFRQSNSHVLNTPNDAK